MSERWDAYAVDDPWDTQPLGWVTLGGVRHPLFFDEAAEVDYESTERRVIAHGLWAGNTDAVSMDGLRDMTVQLSNVVHTDYWSYVDAATATDGTPRNRHERRQKTSPKFLARKPVRA